MVFVYNVVSVIILSFFKAEQSKVDYKKTCIGILKNPLILGIVAGVLVSLLPFKLPQVINKTISMISSTATPLGLMAMGATFDFDQAKGRSAVTLSANITYLKPGKGNYITAQAEIVKYGKQTAFAKCNIYNEKEELIATMDGNYFFID